MKKPLHSPTAVVSKNDFNMNDSIPVNIQQDVGNSATSFPLQSATVTLQSASVIPETPLTAGIKDVIDTGDHSLKLSGLDNITHENILSSSAGVPANTYTTDSQVTMDSFTLPNTCSVPLDTNSTITNSNVMLSSVSIAGQSVHGSLQNISLLSQSPIKADATGNLSQEIPVLDTSTFLNINQEDLQSVNSILDSLEIVDSRNSVDGTNMVPPHMVEYHIQQYSVPDTVSVNSQSNMLPVNAQSNMLLVNAQPNMQLVNSQNQYVLQNAPTNRVDQTVPYSQVHLVQTDNPCYVLPTDANSNYVMAKTQATAVRKTVSNYIPDLSSLAAVCLCPRGNQKVEIPIEQIVTVTPKNGAGKLIRYLKVHIIVISMEEFVAFQKDDNKLYVSVGEIVQRLIPGFKKEVENYINTDMECEMSQMSFFEIQYIKQRRCVSFQLTNWMLISLTTLRRMCREFLKQKAFVRSLTNRLQNAANAPYFIKRLGKHTRCSVCGGAVKMLDIADEYVWLCVPLPEETEIRCGTYDIDPSSMNTVPQSQTPSENLPEVTGSEGEDRHIDIKHLFVSSITFHSFQIIKDASKAGNKTYLSVKELVDSRVLSVQALQIGLQKQQYAPRRAPTIVDDYYRKHSVDVDETLWIDLLTIRCVCCMGKQSNGYSMDLYNRFSRGQWKEEVVCTILGPDDREDERKVFTLFPGTYKISLKDTEPLPVSKHRRKPRESRVNKYKLGKIPTSTELVSCKQVSKSEKSKPQLEDTSQSNISSTSDFYKEERKKNVTVVSENGEKTMNSKKEKQDFQPGIYYFENKKSVLEFLNANDDISADSSPEKGGKSLTSTSNQFKQTVVRKDQFKKMAEAQQKNFRVEVKPARTPYKSSKQKAQTQQRNEVNEIEKTSQRGCGQSGVLIERKQTSEKVYVCENYDSLNENVQYTEENVVTSTQITDSDNNERVIVVTNSVMPDFTPLSSLDLELKEQEMVDTTILEPVCDSNMSESSRSLTDQSGYHGNMADMTNKVSNVTEEVCKSALEKVSKSLDKDIKQVAIKARKKEECVHNSENKSKISENSKSENSNEDENVNILTNTSLSLHSDKNYSAIEEMLERASPVFLSKKKKQLPKDLGSEESNQSLSSLNLGRCSDQFLSPISSPQFSKSPVFKKSPMFSSPTSRDGKRLKKLYDKVASVNADESLAFLATVATECSQEDSDLSQSETEESCDESMLNKESVKESECIASVTKEIRGTSTLKKQTEVRNQIEIMLKDIAKCLLINYKQETEGLRVSLKFKGEAPQVFPELFKKGNGDKKKIFLQIISSYIAYRYYNRKAAGMRKRKKKTSVGLRQSKRKRLNKNIDS